MPSLSALLLPFWDATILVLSLIALTRLAGLRSFSKMSGYDFAITVATGSVLASVIVTKTTGVLVGIAALLAPLPCPDGIIEAACRDGAGGKDDG